MNLLFTIVYCIWFLSEILLNRLLRSKSTDKQNADRHSLSLIWITVIVTVGLSIYISMRYYLPISHSSAIRYIGLALVGIGIILRLVAVISLGRLFTVDVTIRQNHTLKQDGVYKYLRHPSYFASLLSFIGFGISLNNWISLLLITAAVLTVFIIRIKIEEKMLIRQFGVQYTDYKKSTSGLIPFIY